MAELLKTVLGHHEQIEKLQQAEQQQRLPPGFLFTGPEGVGRKKLALAFIQRWVCSTATLAHPAACGHCGPCVRLEKMQSEALLILSPEKNQIKIEQVQQVLEFLNLQALCRARAVIIDGAQNLNPQAANALLKILEEPPPQVYFFLLAPSPQHVLPTLRSRVQVMRFMALEPALLRQGSGQKSALPEWVVQASQGSLLRVRQLLASEENTAREHAQSFLQMYLQDHQAYLKPQWRELIPDRSGALSLSEHLTLFLRDALLLQVGAAGPQVEPASTLDPRSLLLNGDQVDLLKALAAQPRTWLHKACQKVLQLQTALLAQREPQLVFEEFWLT